MRILKNKFLLSKLHYYKISLLFRAKSFDSPKTTPVTPQRKTPSHLSSSAKKVFGSIEKGLECVKTFLTPKKRLYCGSDTPRKVTVCIYNLHNAVKLYILLLLLLKYYYLKIIVMKYYIRKKMPYLLCISFIYLLCLKFYKNIFNLY